MTKNGLQVPNGGPAEIAILCYPGSQATCVFGLTDLFMYADYFARMHAAQRPAATPRPVEPGDAAFLRVTHWRETADGVDFECSHENCASSGNEVAIVVVPAYQLGPPEPNYSPRSTEWITRKHAGGSAVAAVCGGVFLLAEAGLLAGRCITTHWKFAEQLRQRCPELRIDAHRLVIDDHDIVTAGGVLAWIDLGLTLVERLLGRTVMVSTARFMLVDPPGRKQSLYEEFAPPLLHGDKAVLSIQHWLQANIGRACSVEALAKQAGLGQRTFLRRFVRATGKRPSEYLQRLRIARSRELLEFTRNSVDQVAVAAGYEDARGFRRTFKRVVGLSPAEYRRRFALGRPA
jgi:transcriptional regulator GlxA family with amidase domain